MKTSQLIATEESASEAMDLATEKAIAVDHIPALDISKYTFSDNSVLVFKGWEYFGFDADDWDSLREYTVWFWKVTAGASDADRATEHGEICRLFEALN
jgi:hypothetical protein